MAFLLFFRILVGGGYGWGLVLYTISYYTRLYIIYRVMKL